MNSVNTDINEEVLMNRMWISVGHFHWDFRYKQLLWKKDGYL